MKLAGCGALYHYQASWSTSVGVKKLFTRAQTKSAKVGWSEKVFSARVQPKSAEVGGSKQVFRQSTAEVGWLVEKSFYEGTHEVG